MIARRYKITASPDSTKPSLVNVVALYDDHWNIQLVVYEDANGERRGVTTSSSLMGDVGLPNGYSHALGTMWGERGEKI